MEVEQITPEQEAQFGAMDVAQLEAHVASEEGAAPQENSVATAQPQGEAVGTKDNKENSETKAPAADAEPAWFTAYKAEQKRELGSLRSLQGLSDKLPKLIEQQLNQRLQAMQQAQQNANLSPEDQEAQAQLQTQQDALKQFVREQAGEVLGEQGKEYIEILTELKEQRQDYNHKATSLELVKEFIPEGAEKAWDGFFEKVAKDIESGNADSIKLMERVEKDPAYLALQLVQFQRSQVQGQASQVTQQRSTAAKAAAQGVKQGGQPTAGKKAVAEMNETELNGMSIAELEAAIPEQ